MNFVSRAPARAWQTFPARKATTDEKTNKQKAEKMAAGVYRIEFGMVGRSGERVNVCKTSAREWAEDEYARMGWGRARANGLGTSTREWAGDEYAQMARAECARMGWGRVRVNSFIARARGWHARHARNG